MFLLNYRHFFPFVAPLINFALLEFFVKYPTNIYYVLIACLLVSSFTIWAFSLDSKMGKKWQSFVLLPILFESSLVAYVTIVPQAEMVQFLILLNALLLYLYLRACFFYFDAPKYYKMSSIENISLYGSFLAVFFAGSSLYGYNTILSIEIWKIILPFVLIVILSLYQVMWANKIELKDSAIYIGLGSLVLLEVGWSLSYLPLNFNNTGLIFALIYYMFIGLTRLEILGKLDGKMIKQYISFGFISIIIILLSSRWL